MRSALTATSRMPPPSEVSFTRRSVRPSVPQAVAAETLVVGLFRILAAS